MFKRIFIIIIAAMFVLILNAYCFAQEKNLHQHDNKHEHHQAVDAATSATPQLSGNLEDSIRVVEVRAFKYGFEPDPIVVKQGEKVKLELTSEDVKHGLGISEFGVNVVAPKGKTVSVEFTADKVGVFHIHCTVYCGPGHGEMHGTLKVK